MVSVLMTTISGMRDDGVNHQAEAERSDDDTLREVGLVVQGLVTRVAFERSIAHHDCLLSDLEAFQARLWDCRLIQEEHARQEQKRVMRLRYARALQATRPKREADSAAKEKLGKVVEATKASTKESREAIAWPNASPRLQEAIAGLIASGSTGMASMANPQAKPCRPPMATKAA